MKKLKVQVLPFVVNKELQSKEDIEMLTVDQSTEQNGHGPVLAEASRESGEEGLAGTSATKTLICGKKTHKTASCDERNRAVWIVAT